MSFRCVAPHNKYKTFCFALSDKAESLIGALYLIINIKPFALPFLTKQTFLFGALHLIINPASHIQAATQRLDGCICPKGNAILYLYKK